MGRLIDGTIQALPMSNYILERKETFIKVLENGDNDFLFAMLMEYFDKQPAVYDVEGVINKLDELDTYKEVVTSNKHPFSCSEIETISKSNAIALVRKGEVE